MLFGNLAWRIKPRPLYHYPKSGSKNVVIGSGFIQDQTFVENLDIPNRDYIG